MKKTFFVLIVALVALCALIEETRAIEIEAFPMGAYIGKPLAFSFSRDTSEEWGYSPSEVAGLPSKFIILKFSTGEARVMDITSEPSLPSRRWHFRGTTYCMVYVPKGLPKYNIFFVLEANQAGTLKVTIYNGPNVYPHQVEILSAPRWMNQTHLAPENSSPITTWGAIKTR